MSTKTDTAVDRSASSKPGRLFWWRDAVFFGAGVFVAHFYMQFALPYIDNDLELLAFIGGFILSLLVLTIVHELGHILAAVFIRWKILEVVVWGIGYYPQTHSWRRISGGLRAHQDFAGWVFAVPRNNGLNRSHQVISTLGGPIMTFGLGLTCFVIFWNVNLTQSHMNLLLFIAFMLMLDGITNLVPLDKNGQAATDGKILLDLLRGDRTRQCGASDEIVWQVEQQLIAAADVSREDLDRLATLLEDPEKLDIPTLSVLSWAFFLPDKMVELKQTLRIWQAKGEGFYEDHKSNLAFAICIVERDGRSAMDLLKSVSRLGQTSLHYFRALACAEYLLGNYQKAEKAIEQFRSLGRALGNEKDADDEALFIAITARSDLPWAQPVLKSSAESA